VRRSLSGVQLTGGGRLNRRRPTSVLLHRRSFANGWTPVPSAATFTQVESGAIRLSLQPSLPRDPARPKSVQCSGTQLCDDPGTTASALRS
jgi:hypothetical protein